MTKTEDQDELSAHAARLAALPTFRHAVREYTIGLARFRESPRLANKLISYDTRWRVVGYLLYLAADRELFGPEGGATYGRMLEICTRRQEVSPRVLKTMLALLKFTGFVETVRSSTDRRSKMYRPTARMGEFVNRWLSYAVGALDILEPEMQRTRMLREDPGFPDRFLVSGGRDHLAGTPPADRMPDFIAFYGARDGAGAAVLAVMLADIDGTPVPSRAAIAKKFGLSKTQVSNVMAVGEAKGFFTLDDAGVPAATQYLRDSYGRWISIELAFYARHMRPQERAGQKMVAPKEISV
jgi:DNA-binding MarR family transcriptional regulator